MPAAAFRIHRLDIEGFKAFAAPRSFEIGGGHVFVFGTNGLGKSSVQQLATAKEEFEELTEQLQTAHARVESCERDLKNVLGDTTSQQLLKEHDELVRQNNQLAQYITLVQQAVGYLL